MEGTMKIWISGPAKKQPFLLFGEKSVPCFLIFLFVLTNIVLGGCVEKKQDLASESGCPPCVTCQPCPIPPACTPVMTKEIRENICEPCPPCPSVPADQEKKKEVRPHLSRLAPADYPLFKDDLGYEGLEKVLTQSIAFYNRIPASRPVRFGGDVYTASHMKNSCMSLLKLIRTHPDERTLNRVIRNNFFVYKATGTPPPGTELRPEGKVLFTGYYEPLLRGSLAKTPDFSVPLHGPPEDLITVDLAPFGKEFAGKRIRGHWTGKTFEPYHDWEAINYKGAVDGKASVIAYIGHEVDKFFLQVQGSGVVYLEEGEPLRVHYKTQNGRPYHSVGAYLVQSGKIPKEEISMQKIREYLKANPEEQRRILSKNPSYVFFEVVEEGPLGALNIPLTPGRSLAIDRKLFPDGAPAFIHTEKPLLFAEGQIASWQPFSRFMAAQDTGGAIRGSGRADIFWGNDDYAEVAAGYLQHPGDMYFLVLKIKK